MDLRGPTSKGSEGRGRKGKRGENAAFTTSTPH